MAASFDATTDEKSFMRATGCLLASLMEEG